MGNAHALPPFLGPPPAGVTRVCVTGFTLSTHTGRAQQVAAALAASHPDQFESWFYFGSNAEYRGGVSDRAAPPGGVLATVLSWAKDDSLKAHRSSPFCWLERSEPFDGSVTTESRPGVHIRLLGGRDRLCEWVHGNVKDEAILRLAIEPSLTDAWVDETPGSSQQKK